MMQLIYRLLFLAAGFEKDDILLSNIQPILQKDLVMQPLMEGVLTDVLVLNCKNQKFHPKYVYYSLFQDLFLKHMMNGAKEVKSPEATRDI